MVKLKVSALVAAAAVVMIGLGVGWADDGPPKVVPAPAPSPRIQRAKLPPAPAEHDHRTSIRFTGPAGMKVSWQQTTGPTTEKVELTVPKESSFRQGQTYRLRLTDIKPDHPGKTFYPTLEVAPETPRTKTFLELCSVPVAFTGEDFDQAADGNLVVKVIYLPDPEFQDLAAVAGAEEITSPRLEPGVDPVAEGKRRGTILAVVRLGNIDLDGMATPATKPPPAAARPAPGGTVNFVVTAPTPVIARAVANEAEYQRKALAERWLGRELPAWPKPCPIRVTVEARQGGATTFTFPPDRTRPRGFASAEMELHGTFESVLTTDLPHEIAHTVLAAYFGKPVPRWADEGIALMAEPPEAQAKYDAQGREQLAEGRAVRLKVLFAMTEYPRDMMVLYAQGYSVCRFLAGRKPGMIVRVFEEGHSILLPGPFGFEPPGEAGLIAFLRIGMDGKAPGSWEKAAKDVYGFESVDALEAAWIDWLKTPGSRFDKPTPSPTRPLKPLPGETDLIPPTKLPTKP